MLWLNFYIIAVLVKTNNVVKKRKKIRLVQIFNI